MILFRTEKMILFCGDQRHTFLQALGYTLRIFIFFSLSALYAQVHCEIVPGSTDSSGTLLCSLEEKAIGQISYKKIFDTSYLLHTLYIDPQYRGQRYSHSLVDSAQNHLSSLAKKLYIQPGPFERGRQLEKAEKIVKSEKLIRLYTSYGFSPASVREKRVAYWIYKCFVIDDDSSLLMVKKIS